MSPKAIPPFRRRRLGRRIRELRESARMTLEVAAKALDMNRFTLARLESGANKMDVHIARSMMDVYDCYDSGLLDEVRKAVPPGWWTKYGIRDRGYIGMETEASRVREFSVINVPGLLQTEEYTRALLTAGPVAWTDEQLANHVRARQVRQRRLVDEDFPLQYEAVIDEAVLHRRVGGQTVMAAQCAHMVARAQHSTVDLRVVPFGAGAHVGMDGAFIVLGFPEGDDHDIAYIAYPTGAAHIERASEIAEARLMFTHVRTQALTPEESVLLIERVGGGYRSD